jgi:hypothetical protein
MGYRQRRGNLVNAAGDGGYGHRIDIMRRRLYIPSKPTHN